MKPLPLCLSNLQAGHRALLASTLLHGAGIATAVMLTLPHLSSARWSGAESTVRSAIALKAPPAPRPVAAAAATAVVVEPPLPAPRVVELGEPQQPDVRAVVPDPVEREPHATACLADTDWLTCLRAAARVATLATAAATPAPSQAEPDPLPAQDAVRVDPSPIPGHNAPPRYPFVAWRRGIEGTVVVELDLDAAGAVTDARIASSSGSALLDNAALEQLRTWTFTPMRGPAGPVRCQHRQVVVFRIRG